MQPESLVTLKLDASYRPIEVIKALEALVLCLIGKAKAIEEHETQIRSPTKTFNLPAVIVVNRVVKYKLLGSKASRKNVCIRDKNTCQYCKIKLPCSDLTIDHVVPKSQGGGNEWTNLVACCKRCNQRKGPRTPKEAKMSLIREPYQPHYTEIKIRVHYQDIWENYLW
jgi:5-methylcytosine-specific restriction endonuclease McrA